MSGRSPSRPGVRRGVAWGTALALGGAVVPVWAADDPKSVAEKKPDPPQVLMALPLALKVGVTNHVTFRGLNLTNVTALLWTNPPAGASAIMSRASKADVPKETDAKKVGDTQVAAEVFLPTGMAAGTNWFTLVSTNGVSAAHPIRALPATELVDELEPNGGFRSAQVVAPGKTVAGTIREAGDVDVFRFDGLAGHWVRVEIGSAAGGLPLDSLVTLYDAEGHVLASADDVAGSFDTTLNFRLPSTDAYFVGVVDAGDKGSTVHAYLLRIECFRDGGARVP